MGVILQPLISSTCLETIIQADTHKSALVLDKEGSGIEAADINLVTSATSRLAQKKSTPASPYSKGARFPGASPHPS